MSRTMAHSMGKGCPYSVASPVANIIGGEGCSSNTLKSLDSRNFQWTKTWFFLGPNFIRLWASVLCHSAYMHVLDAVLFDQTNK